MTELRSTASIFIDALAALKHLVERCQLTAEVRRAEAEYQAGEVHQFDDVEQLLDDIRS